MLSLISLSYWLCETQHVSGIVLVRIGCEPSAYEPTIDRATITPSNPSCSCPLEFSDCYLAGTWRHGIAQDRISMVEERLYEDSFPSKRPLLQVVEHSMNSTRP